MQYISFYKDRLPFKPKSNVVIYFDVTGIGAKRYYHVVHLHDERNLNNFIFKYQVSQAWNKADVM